MVKPSSIGDRLRGLRLICRHCPNNKDLISKAVNVVRKDMAKPDWDKELQYQYDLLPQKIKSYLKIRTIVKVKILGVF